jgi:Tfp pilus assembly protein PilF
MALDTKKIDGAQANPKAIKRSLMLHDGAAFLILAAVTVVLFGVTLFLFRSFSAHRQELAVRWSERGRAALAAGHPEEATAALRTALSYAPDERDYQLLLAEALGDAGHIEEATNYFLNLWESKPGDGFINLQLARLTRKSNADKQSRLGKTREPSHNSGQRVIDYYRASIYGSWDGDGVVHRRDVRLELADYLIEERKLAEAQTELLIAASNAPAIYDLQVGLGDALVRAGDSTNALVQYEKAIQEDQRNPIAYEKAGRLAYRIGDYVRARDWLERALRESAGAPGDAADSDSQSEGDLSTLLKDAERILALSPDRATNPKERVARILNEKALAKKRYDGCAKQAETPGSLNYSQTLGSMQTLGARWASESATNRVSLVENDARQAAVQELVDDTEKLTAQVCGQPTGDDALLLRLAKAGKN